MELPQRKQNRLSDFDYNQNGAYFITICTQDRKPILSTIVGGGALDAPVFGKADFGMHLHTASYIKTKTPILKENPGFRAASSEQKNQLNDSTLDYLSAE